MDVILYKKIKDVEKKTDNVQQEVNELDLDHNTLTNYVANEHINHANISITAGTGLSGGGTLLETRTLNVDYGTTAGTACQGNDARLSDARVASDVFAWAKAATKPSYTNTEVGAAATSHTHGGGDITSAVANATNATTLGGASPSTTATASSIVQRDSNGYIHNNYFNMSANSITTTITQVAVGQGDGYIRWASTASNWCPRRVVHSTSNPSGGADGDVWLKY